MDASNVNSIRSNNDRAQASLLPSARVANSRRLELPPLQHQRPTDVAAASSLGAGSPPLPALRSPIDSGRTRPGIVEPPHLSQSLTSTKQESSPRTRGILPATQLIKLRTSRNVVVPTSSGDATTFPNVASALASPQSPIEPNKTASVHWGLALVAALELALKVAHDETGK